MKEHLLSLTRNCIVLGAVLLLYGVFCEPNCLQVTHYTIKNPELSGIKIAFASDFHVSKRHLKRLYKTINAINAEKPDLVILGGDYVKGHKKNSSLPIEQIATAFTHLKSPQGTYAVLGNHDHYYGKKEVTSALKNAGITVLDNKNRRLNINNKELTLAGVADYSEDKPDLIKAFKNATAPAILVSHSPDIFPASPKTALTLAAHTHGGQIRLPIFGAPLIPSEYKRRYDAGFIRENAKDMIVTQGLGTSLLPIRLNCPPEIVIISFK